MSPRPPLGIERWGNLNSRQVGKGKWVANTYYRDARGQRRRMERYGVTKTAALAKLEDALREGLTDTSAEVHASSTLAALIEAWWPEYLQGGPATQTVTAYRRSLDEIAAAVGEMRIREATVPWLDRYLKEIAKGRGISVARRHKVLFSHMLGYALRHGATTSNAAEDTRPPTAKAAPVLAPDAEAIDVMRAAFSAYDARPRTLPFLSDFADLLVATGARTSEVLALRWQDVDLAAGKVTISGTLIEADGKVIRQEHPKTDAGWRRLTLTDDAIALLMARRTVSLTEWVLCARGGGVRQPSNVRRSWRTALKETAYRGTTPKGYRKAVATALAREMGADAAAQQLGHKSSSTTKAFYIERLHEGPDARAVLERLRAVPVESGG